jgi:hypothetical protein
MNTPSRPDRALVFALGVVIATVSAACGAATNYHPSTDGLPKLVASVIPPKPVAQSPVMLTAEPSEASLKSENSIMTKLLAEHRCLSEVMYYEARGEGKDGQKAIAEVIFRRMQTGNYGHSICAVVYEGAPRKGCQFSFACSNQVALRKNPVAWRSAQTLAARILTGEERLKGVTGAATHFHAISVEPGWANTLTPTVQIGNHVFYSDRKRKPPVQTLEHDEPADQTTTLPGSES